MGKSTGASGKSAVPTRKKTQPLVALLGLAILLGLVFYVVRVGLPEWRSGSEPSVSLPATPSPAPSPAAPIRASATAEAERFTAEGVRQLLQNRMEEAKESLDRALAASPGYAPAKLALFEYYNMRRDFESAIREASEVLAADPANLDARFAKAVGQTHQRYNDEALETLAPLLEREPRNSRYRYYQALALVQKEKFEAALEALYKVADDAVQDAQYFNLRAQILCDEERWAEALPDWDQLLKREPTNDHAAGMKGLSMAYAGRRQEALGWMQRGLLIEVDDPATLREQAADARKRGDEETARKYEELADRFEKFIAERDRLLAAISANPADPDLYYDLGVLYRENDFVSRSIPVFLRALALDGSHAPAMLALGDVYLSLHEPRMYFRYLERYLKLKPEDLQVRMTLALEYEKFRRFPDGLRVMREYPQAVHPDIEYVRTLRRMKRSAGE
ncbi:tetratricopeptide repeat protein [bacterium]|nr:tetratricopeptide repeat protein [bacterium]